LQACYPKTTDPSKRGKHINQAEINEFRFLGLRFHELLSAHDSNEIIAIAPKDIDSPGLLIFAII